MRLSFDEFVFFSSVKAGDLSSVVQALRSEPYLVNFQDEIGKTPLHLAVENGLLEMVRTLIAYGADLDITDIEGNTPIHSAIERCLSLNGAYRKNFIEIANALFGSGADANCMDNAGFSLLHLATGMGDLEVLSFLIEKGADVNGRSRSGYTSLHWGLCANIWEQDIQKYLDVLEFLIKNGAAVNAKTTDGKSSLVVAAENNPGRPQLRKLLQKYGAK